VAGARRDEAPLIGHKTRSLAIPEPEPEPSWIVVSTTSIQAVSRQRSGTGAGYVAV
jgi:hypothetical protein